MVSLTSFMILSGRLRLVKVLKEMGNEFLSGYITLAEGEKDPRNLLLAFAINRVILIEFNINDFVEVCTSTSTSSAEC
jgi:Dos2-interacting transcription regulator of RNA-Pol-II